MTEKQLEDLRAGACGRAFIEQMDILDYPYSPGDTVFSTYQEHWIDWATAWLGCQREIGREARAVAHEDREAGDYLQCVEFVDKLAAYGEPHDDDD